MSRWRRRRNPADGPCHKKNVSNLWPSAESLTKESFFQIPTELGVYPQPRMLAEVLRAQLAWNKSRGDRLTFLGNAPA